MAMVPNHFQNGKYLQEYGCAIPDLPKHIGIILHHGKNFLCCDTGDIGTYSVISITQASHMRLHTEVSVEESGDTLILST